MRTEELPAPVTGRRWTRRADDRWLAGVASGLADGAEIPIWVARGLFILATFIGGLGVLVYVFLWWLLPRRDLPTSGVERTAARLRGAPTWAGVALLAFGVMLFAGELGWWRPSLVLAFALIGLGIVLFRREPAGSQTERPNEGPSGDDMTLATAPTAEGALLRTDPTDAGRPGTAVLPAPRRARAPRERSFLGPLAFGIALLAVGAAALLDMAGVLSLTLGGAFSLFLLLVGAGLLVGAWIGRARWLLVPALLVAPVALVTTVVTVDLEEGFADRTFTPEAASAFPADYGLAGGTLGVDLTELPPSVVAPEITASLGVGELILYVPEGAGLAIDGDVGIGTVQVIRFGDAGRSGGSIERTTSQTGGVDLIVADEIAPTSGAPMITAHVHVSIGQLTIYRMVEPRSTS